LLLCDRNHLDDYQHAKQESELRRKHFSVVILRIKRSNTKPAEVTETLPYLEDLLEYKEAKLIIVAVKDLVPSSENALALLERSIARHGGGGMFFVFGDAYSVYRLRCHTYRKCSCKSCPTRTVGNDYLYTSLFWVRINQKDAQSATEYQKWSL
jgi:hypothetical protein